MVDIGEISYSSFNRNFLNMLLPLRCMQHATLFSIFTIQHNRIKTHSTRYYIAAFIGVLGFIICRLVIKIEDLYFKNFSWVIRIINKNIYFTWVLVLLTFFFTNFLKRHHYVGMVLRIQRSFKELNYKHYLKITIWNWFVVLSHLIFLVYVIFIFFEIKKIFIALSFIGFDIHITVSILFMNLIREGLVTWISDVEGYSKQFHHEEEQYNERMKIMFQIYLDLMGAFDLFKSIYQFVVSQVWLCSNFSWLWSILSDLSIFFYNNYCETYEMIEKLF